ncbi:hypothetical protein GE061_007039 [Apolygus lucorum]|uniref:Peptidase S1 domain-containing protein n=1 Tax=Apolygus lucorum TaxID=248454 RepID=A0A8S9WT62_APOLU|nr:hypothetical protein GE061_007039 [Apolygus lucorum]
MANSNVVIIACSLLALTFYSTEAVPRIIDGILAHIQDFPFVALISPRNWMGWQHQRSMQVHCGGSLIHPKFVVTAYHCFMKKANASNYVVYFYVQNRCQPSNFPPHDIQRLHTRPDSLVGSKVQHDIMVLELVQPRVLPFYAQLPTERLTVSQIGTVVGFGLVKIVGSGNPKDLPCSLQQMNEFVLPLARCDFLEGRIIGAFCAFNPLRHFATACRGDSGGPWFTRDANGEFILFGVSSFGDEKCNQERFHDAFTNVYFYREWIIGIVNGFIF